MKFGLPRHRHVCSSVDRSFLARSPVKSSTQSRNNIMLTSAIRRVFIGALATGSVAVIAAASGAIANQNSSGVATFRPIQGISFQLGSKRAVGYFEPRNGKCLVTLMIAEKVDPDQARPSSAARLSLAMLPGQSAALASEEGTSMQLTCGAAAETVAVKLTGERMTASSGWP
jgi:hypothetical protein